MNIEKKKSKLSKKAVAIASLAVLILVVAGGFVAAYQLGIIKSTPEDRGASPVATNQVDYDPPTDEQKQTGIDAKKDFIERTEREDATSESGLSSVSITTASQEDSTLRIRTTISSKATGVCKLTLSKAGQADIIRDAETQDMGTYSTCKGFDVDTGTMAKGDWKVSVGFSEDAQGTLATTVVEVR